MQEAQHTALEREIIRRYTWQLALLMLLYVAILVGSILLLENGNFSRPLRALIAVTPAIPMFGVVAAVVRFMLHIDELQRQIHLESLAIAAGVTAALALTYTFLEGAGMPHSQAWWWFVCVDAVWVISLPFVKRRYE